MRHGANERSAFSITDSIRNAGAVARPDTEYEAFSSSEPAPDTLSVTGAATSRVH